VYSLCLPIESKAGALKTMKEIAVKLEKQLGEQLR
jgi:hypothetical protein